MRPGFAEKPLQNTKNLFPARTGKRFLRYPNTQEPIASGPSKPGPVICRLKSLLIAKDQVKHKAVFDHVLEFSQGKLVRDTCFNVALRLETQADVLSN